MKILVGGDLVPTESNIALFSSNNLLALLGEDLVDLFQKADCRVFNLEAPLYDGEGRIQKCGPHLKAPTAVIEGIKGLNPNVFTLANNHIFDYGFEGLKSTMDVLSKAGIGYVGAGKDLEQAKTSQILKFGNQTVGFYACAEHEFSIADEHQPGANPFDFIDSFDHISELKKKVDFVIVLFHGGKEYYRYPSPMLQKICRKMVDCGASLVVCQHSHCIGSYELYKNSHIVYGQGNFIFDDSEKEFWLTSLVVQLETEPELKISFIPIVKEKQTIRLADDSQKEKILKEFLLRSEQIQKPGFIKEKYEDYSLTAIDNYLMKISGRGKLMSRMDKYVFKGALSHILFRKKNYWAALNVIECEAHRELMISGIKTRLYKKKSEK